MKTVRPTTAKKIFCTEVTENTDPTKTTAAPSMGSRTQALTQSSTCLRRTDQRAVDAATAR
ncbi:hypothetical protein ACIBQ6_02265 [Nonomuraea sp. NPDC049655]|uniref:hypothetical protein n=1 Tax=Nonomuraea sp. NPDC049655 TaxID=3364355 RepID=UPI0037890A96